MQDSSKHSEQSLAERLRLGDNKAMREFYALYGSYLTAVCARYIADEEDIKDVVQEAMVRVFTRARQFEFRGEGSLKSWAARIVSNESLDYLRDKKRINFRELDDDIADDEAEDPEIDDIPPDEIQRMICQLPTGYRTVFNLYVIEGKSHREIAGMLGINVKTSASQLSRAKNRLSKMIGEYRQRFHTTEGIGHADMAHAKAKKKKQDTRQHPLRR